MRIEGFDFAPLYWGEEIALDLDVRLLHEGSRPSPRTWTDPGDPGEPPDVRVVGVTVEGRRCDWLAADLRADEAAMERVTGIVVELLEEERGEYAGERMRDYCDEDGWRRF